MTTPRSRYDVARESYEGHARRHPVKAARLLVRLEADLPPFVDLDDPRPDDRLAGTINGLRAGLDGTVRCRVCGRALETPRAVERRIGDDCWAKIQKARAA